jgi:hypothetical protein
MKFQTVISNATDAPMNLTFAWWNVGLKPPVASASEPPRSSVLKPWFLFCHLNETVELDFIAFGEVSSSFLQQLAPSFRRCGFSEISIAEKEGRIIFDICVFYRTSKLTFLSKTNIIFPHYSGSLRVGSRLEFEHAITLEKFFIYVSHWPSRLSRPDLGRDELGSKLRADINEIYAEEGYDANIILLGDYNDEPFDKPIFDKLIASRDRDVVLSKPYMLYNPFWRNMGTSTPYFKGKPLSKCHGTYFYKSSMQVTKWFTFDQIIVSSSLMGHGKWHLDEEKTKVFHYTDDDYLGKSFFQTFDHLPIFSRITRE